MTRDETARLLDRLKAAYGRRWDQDTLREWHGFLQHYGARHCNDALDALVEDGEDGPNLPRFLQTVKQRQPARPALEGPDPCALCDGTGWVWAPPVQHRGYAYTQVQPCRCTTGRRMATVHAGILATNGDLT